MHIRCILVILPYAGRAAEAVPLRNSLMIPTRRCSPSSLAQTLLCLYNTERTFRSARRMPFTASALRPEDTKDEGESEELKESMLLPAGWLALINLVSFAAYGIDKLKAIRH